MSSPLFSPLTVGPFTLPNRIAVAPMCQYSADDGSANDWHLQHWMSLAMSGAGMITIEATGVERRGRITHGCLGLYSDDNEAALARGLAAARRVAPKGTRLGIQLGHAGRKASTQRPWEGGGTLGTDEDPWETVAPSALAFTPGWHVPTALDEAGIERVTEAFVSAAKRAARIGLDFIELHGAHGYLIHQFLSPLSNKRTDKWGGSLENRARFGLDIARAVKAALPDSMLMGVRMSVTDWVEGGFNPDEAVEVARAFKAAGAGYVCASSGGGDPNAKIPVGPGYQVPLADRIRKDVGIATRAVGLIDDPMFAEKILADGKADIIALARAFLADPRWPWRAASTLGGPIQAVPQYARSVSFINHWAPPLAKEKVPA